MRQRNLPRPFTAGQANQAIARQAARVAPGLIGRATGLFGRAATIAAAPEAAVAVAAGGLAYGIGEDLLSNYGYGNSTRSIPQRTKPPLTDPTSRGSRKVSHQHGTQKKSDVNPAINAQPTAPQQPEVQAAPAPVLSSVIPPRPEIAPLPPQQPEVQARQLIAPVPSQPSPPTPGRFQQSLVDLHGQSQPVHGFKIPRTRPYNLTAWERAARAKAQSVRGY